MFGLFARNPKGKPASHPQAGRPAAAAKPGTTRLSPEVMKKVRRIEIATNRLVDQGVAGDYHSVFRGRGMEFAEVRPYQPGDEVRTIDWNVTARMGAPYVKQFVEERDLTIFLAIDVSGSLSFGSRAILKREMAAEISALIAFAAVRNHDRVGAALLSDGLDLFLAPQRRRTHVLRLVREVLERPAEGGTDLEAGLSAVLGTLKRRAVLFVISDFLGASCSTALKTAALRHDLITVEIMDPRDVELPAVGPVVLRDAETGQAALVDGRRLGKIHRARRERERVELIQFVRRLGADHLTLRTDRPYLNTLLAFFEQRRKRLGR